MYGLGIPWWIDLGIHVAWVVLLVNAFNLIDGMDGLCSGLGVISLTVLAVLALVAGRVGDAALIGVMVVALMAFLRHNFHPAKIFLGDSGSMLIGFFIATVGQQTVGRNAVMAGLLLPLVVAGIPLFDVLLAVWRRGMRRFLISRPGDAAVKIFGADREHLHHRVMSLWGFGQRKAALAIYGLACLLAVIALLPMLGGRNLLAFSVVGLIVVVLIGIRYVAPIEIIESAEGLRALVRRPIRRATIEVTYFLYDAYVLAGSAWLAVWLVERVNLNPLPSYQAGLVISMFTGCGLLGLRFARAHSRRWTRAGVNDYLEMLAWLICGVVTSGALVTLFLRNIEYRNAAIQVAAFGIVVVPLLLPRVLGAGLQSGALATIHHRSKLNSRQGRPTLIYGAGDLGELFLNHLRLTQPSTWSGFSFVGFIDDHLQLRGRRLHGFPILGPLDQLEPLVKRHGIQSVIVTMSRLDPARHAELLRLAEKLRFEIRQWLPDLTAQVVRREESLSPLQPSVVDRRMVPAQISIRLTDGSITQL